MLIARYIVKDNTLDNLALIIDCLVQGNASIWAILPGFFPLTTELAECHLPSFAHSLLTYENASTLD